jgi:hypothetical protein
MSAAVSVVTSAAKVAVPGDSSAAGDTAAPFGFCVLTIPLIFQQVTGNLPSLFVLTQFGGKVIV